MSIKDIKNKMLQFVRDIYNTETLPMQVLILLTNPRSGSTWLFDALRCHPAIYMQSRSNVFEHLKLIGRRYPRDLSETSSLKIEVRPGKWERIPEFRIEKAKDYVSKELMRKPYAIEKIHPDFYKHDLKSIIRNIDNLKKKSKIRFVYQIRDPMSTMVSFLQYQQRNSSWYRRISQEQLPLYMERTYNSIYTNALKYPGIVIDYTELIADFRKAILRIIDYLWPEELNVTAYTNQKLIDLMADLTSRNKRRKTGTTFLGEKPGSQSGTNGKFDLFFRWKKEEIEKCYKPYNLLLSIRDLQNKIRSV